MFSRGMSQVSAMISATFSKVVDIRHALCGRQDDAGPARRETARLWPGPLRSRKPPIAKDDAKFNGGRHHDGSRIAVPPRIPRFRMETRAGSRCLLPDIQPHADVARPALERGSSGLEAEFFTLRRGHRSVNSFAAPALRSPELFPCSLWCRQSRPLR